MHASEVLSVLRTWGLPSDLSYSRLTAKMAMMMSLYSAGRVSDLTLLRVTETFMVLEKDRATLYFDYGAKQDRINHMNPPIVLHAFEDRTLCPIAHLRRYLAVTKKKRRGVAGQPLFLIKVSPYGPAKIFTIRSWIIDILKEAGINASAGSIRAAAATYASASRVSLQRILEAADWSRASTMYNHYVRTLPDEILRTIRAKSDSVQGALLRDFSSQ